MFKEVSDKSTVFFAEMHCYIIARDREKYLFWMLNNVDRFCGMINELLKSKARDGVSASDVFYGLQVVDDCNDMKFMSLIPSREKPGEYDAATYHTGDCRGLKFFAGTIDGRSLTETEREEFADDVMNLFTLFASSLGAIYMECEIDGIKSVWHDDESCYNDCEISEDELTKREVIEGTMRSFMNREKVEDFEGLVISDPETEFDRKFNEGIIHLTNVLKNFM